MNEDQAMRLFIPLFMLGFIAMIIMPAWVFAFKYTRFDLPALWFFSVIFWCIIGVLVLFVSVFAYIDWVING